MRNHLTLVLLLVSSAALAGAPDHPVVGGLTVASGAFPDVALVVAPMALCTGTLIAPDVVLTAGHCIGAHPTEVLLGSVDYTKPGGEAIGVESATAYPAWQTTFDVGVLVLDHPATAKPRPIASACVAKDLAPGNAVTVVGFGLTDAAGTGQNTRLHQARLAVVDPGCTSDLACNAKIAPAGEFVAGGDGLDACFGDSGGPVYLDDALIGVVSRGVGTSREPCGGGGIYVRADRVASWIESTTHRAVTRSTCDAKADGAGADDPRAASDRDDAGGCSTASGAAGWLALALVVGAALVLARRSA